MLGDFGAFAGLFHLTDVHDPVLVASTDGVGTKVLLGMEYGGTTLLGRDLVNLSVNDLITTGARPLFFLDYVGVHAIDHAVMEALVGGMASACRDNGCALLGGETAQLADLYAPGHYDLAGTIVGVVERAKGRRGSTVRAGDRVWGLPSLGLHTNGFSLARQIVRGLDLDTDWAVDSVSHRRGAAAAAPVLPRRSSNDRGEGHRAHHWRRTARQRPARPARTSRSSWTGARGGAADFGLLQEVAAWRTTRCARVQHGPGHGAGDLRRKDACEGGDGSRSRRSAPSERVIIRRR